MDTPTGWERLYELRESAEKVERVVVLVHGTFAGKHSDVGESWWQTNGELFKQFNNKETFVLPFNWSGANSETARRNAALRLWVLLMQIEALQKPYVIVAHSHGGMVAWHALVTCCRWATRSQLPIRTLSLTSSPKKKLAFGRFRQTGNPSIRKPRGLPSQSFAWLGNNSYAISRL